MVFSLAHTLYLKVTPGKATRELVNSSDFRCIKFETVTLSAEWAPQPHYITNCPMNIRHSSDSDISAYLKESYNHVFPEVS